MSKTNKELAVELYGEYLKASATPATNPNFKGNVIIPDLKEIADNVKELAGYLSTIEDQ